jgi:hypothetical protein
MALAMAMIMAAAAEPVVAMVEILGATHGRKR